MSTIISAHHVALVDRKLLFEPTGHLTQKSGKGQPFFLFLIRD
jgi:hypothetical protein